MWFRGCNCQNYGTLRFKPRVGKQTADAEIKLKRWDESLIIFTEPEWRVICVMLDFNKTEYVIIEKKTIVKAISVLKRRNGNQ